MLFQALLAVNMNILDISWRGFCLTLYIFECTHAKEETKVYR